MRAAWRVRHAKISPARAIDSIVRFALPVGAKIKNLPSQQRQVTTTKSARFDAPLTPRRSVAASGSRPLSLHSSTSARIAARIRAFDPAQRARTGLRPDAGAGLVQDVHQE